MEVGRIERVLAGVDASVGAHRALQWAAAVAGATGAELAVVNAFRPDQAELPPGRYEEMLAEREAELATWVSDVGEVSPSMEVRRGDPRPLLRDLAVERQADLLVVGRQGMWGEPGFLHVGSVAEYLGHHAAAPLAVIPADAPPGLGRFVLGVDGSDDSIAAARWCALLAAATSANVTAVCAMEPTLQWATTGTPPGWVEHTKRKLMVDWTADLARAGVVVEPVAVQDLHPADALFQTATDTDADLLVVGMRGLGGFSGLRAGGVALQVLHRAKIPIVLVPGGSGGSA